MEEEAALFDAEPLRRRKWYYESGRPRRDVKGVAWYQCDPPGTWYRADGQPYGNGPAQWRV